MKKFLFLIMFFLLFSLVFPPLFSVFNRIEPWVLGLPFLQFWLLVVGIGICFCLIIVWKIDEKKEAK